MNLRVCFTGELSCVCPFCLRLTWQSQSYSPHTNSSWTRDPEPKVSENLLDSSTPAPTPRPASEDKPLRAMSARGMMGQLHEVFAEDCSKAHSFLCKQKASEDEGKESRQRENYIEPDSARQCQWLALGGRQRFHHMLLPWGGRGDQVASCSRPTLRNGQSDTAGLSLP